jgi:hypothetical protein
MPVREEADASGEDRYGPLRNVGLCGEQRRNSEADYADNENEHAAGKTVSRRIDFY